MMTHADEYRKYAEILALLGDDWECVLEAQEHDESPKALMC